MEPILLLLKLAFTGSLNIVFSSVMVALFLLALASQLGRVSSQALQRIADSAPSLLPTLGILGTFVGICIGLVNFNPQSIDQSVPPLLEGLKTAFVTSVVGVCLAVALRIAGAAMPTSDIAGSADSEQYNRTVLAKLESIRAGIAGSEDGSLLTQIQKMRLESRDADEALARAFREFATTMAENNSKALIQALEAVIRDFNTKLSEQFGDNFKQLNSAVGLLLVWQDNYKTQVERWLAEQRQVQETTSTYLRRAQEAIRASDEALQRIAANTAPLPGQVEHLRKNIEVNQEILNDLTDALDALAEVHDKATQAAPQVAKSLDRLVSQMMKGVQSSIDATLGAVERQSQAHDEQRKRVDELLRQTSATYERIIKNSTEQLAKQVENLDKSMQDEVKRVIETMGSHLASLSHKFVEDYGPLTEKLQRVVSIANGVKG